MASSKLPSKRLQHAKDVIKAANGPKKPHYVAGINLCCRRCGKLFKRQFLDNGKRVTTPLSCPMCYKLTPNLADECAHWGQKRQEIVYPWFFLSIYNYEEPSDTWETPEKSSSKKVNTKARTQQKCEKCGRDEVWFYTLQLRSADEGSTVFYECDCGHKWSLNN